MQPPLEIPGNRDVAPEAVLFHAHATELGLPLPFDILPMAIEDIAYLNGYGPTTFSFENLDLYDQTNYVHTGMDYMPVAIEHTDVVALCEGVIFRGIRGEPGRGSTGDNTGYGFALRCFANDPPQRDENGGGVLSNILVTYNHLSSVYVSGGQIVSAGQILGQTGKYFPCPANQADCQPSNNGSTCDGAGCAAVSGPDHLHIEMFIARGFRDGGSSNDHYADSIRINPLLMYTREIADIHTHPFMRAFYPIDYFGDDGSPGPLLENPPSDFDDSDDLDFGVTETDLNRWILQGDFYGVPSEFSGNTNLWTRKTDENENGIQVLDILGVEWTIQLRADAATSTPLLDVLLDEQYRLNNGYGPIGTPYIGPSCVVVDVTQPLICDHIEGDDTDQDILIEGR
jgi:hypothetical protein